MVVRAKERTESIPSQNLAVVELGCGSAAHRNRTAGRSSGEERKRKRDLRGKGITPRIGVQIRSRARPGRLDSKGGGATSVAAPLPSAIVAVTALFAVLSYTASAAERQELTFSVTFTFPGPSVNEPIVTELNDRVVRVEDVHYFGVGSPESLGDEAGADLSWIVNREQMRGTVSGSVTMHPSAFDLLWEGALRGRVTPDGAEGVLQLTEVSTRQRFSGSWASQGFVDPTSDPHTHSRSS
jgi:hypothetical protein